MYQGNWTCSSCGGAITELPFQPRSNAGLTCRDCYFKTKDDRSQTASTAEVVTAVAEEQPNDAPDNAGIATEPQEDDGRDAVPVQTNERKMFTGDWQCATCGGPITELPFEPRNTSNLNCLDCFKKSKQ